MAVERIDYQAGGVTAKGALVWNDKISGKRPLLLVMRRPPSRFGRHRRLR